MKKIIKNLLRRKKGIAIELAVFVMLVVVSLSALLVSVNILNKSATNSLSTKINERLCLDQIGESFLSAVRENYNLEEWKNGVTDYIATVNVTELTLTLADSQGKTKLFVKLESDTNGYKITEWKYS